MNTKAQILTLLENKLQYLKRQRDIAVEDGNIDGLNQIEAQITEVEDLIKLINI